jgi:DNA replication protein DnaC
MDPIAMKQENASEDSAAAIARIAGHFQAMRLPRMADGSLYLGTPPAILEKLCAALDEQRSEDEKKRFANRLRYAGIVRERSSDTFEWGGDAYPLAEAGAIERALDAGFVGLRKNLIVVGPPGVGKSLLVNIVACKAIRAGFSVRFKTAHDIAMELKEARAGDCLSTYIKRLQACDALVIEDATFATFDSKTAQSFFSIVDGRYGRKTTAITSNGNVNEWAANFPDKRMSSALLGRLYEDAVLVNMNGAKDMRLKRAKGMDALAKDLGGGCDA